MNGKSEKQLSFDLKDLKVTTVKNVIMNFEIHFCFFQE